MVELYNPGFSCVMHTEGVLGSACLAPSRAEWVSADARHVRRRWILSARLGTGLPSAVAQRIIVRATQQVVVEWPGCLLAVWPFDACRRLDASE